MKYNKFLRILALLFAILMPMGCQQATPTEPSETQNMAAGPTEAPTDPIPTAQPKPDGVTPAAVTVMSWNVWHENVWVGQCTNWDRLSRVVQVVEHYSPDVFMTQETTDWFVLYLMQNLPSQYTWAYTQSNGHDKTMPELPFNNTRAADETHSAIFYNEEKLELIDNGMFWLSDTPDVMSKYYESFCFRITTWAKFRDIATGREFICIDVHLDGAADNQINVLMDFVDENIGMPMVLAGDFNKNKIHPIIKNLNNYTPLKDASQAAPKKYTESDTNYDWMFVSTNTIDVQLYQLGIVKGIMNPSDHMPRYAELLIY